MRGRIGERGMFFTEAVLSVCILMSIMLLVFPVMSQVWNERQILRQKAEAIKILRFNLMQWRAGEPIGPQFEVAAPFTLSWKKKTEQETVLSIKWSSGSRHFQLSSEARK